jgi:hypothetical protein
MSDISKHLVLYPAYFPSFVKIYRLYQYFHVSDTSDWEALDSFFYMFTVCAIYVCFVFPYYLGKGAQSLPCLVPSPFPLPFGG